MEQNEIRKMAEAEMWRLLLELTRHFLNILEHGDGMKGSTYKEICDFLSQNGINLKEKPARSYSDEVEDLDEQFPFLEDGSPNPEFERSLNCYRRKRVDPPASECGPSQKLHDLVDMPP